MADRLWVDGPTLGVRTVAGPWAEATSRFTAECASLGIDGLQEASVSTVTRLMGVSWMAIDRIRQRGFVRRQAHRCAHDDVDDTSFRKRHDYVAIGFDTQASKGLPLEQDRTKAALVPWYTRLTSAQLRRIERVSMGLWPAYIKVMLEPGPGPPQKMAFGRFHMTKCLTTAVDAVRRLEHRPLMKQGLHDLKGAKYDWLTNPVTWSDRQTVHFEPLCPSTLKMARTWAIKGMTQQLWPYVLCIGARKGWLSWAMRYRREPVKAAVRTITRYLWGLLNAIVLKVSHEAADGLTAGSNPSKCVAGAFVTTAGWPTSCISPWRARSIPRKRAQVMGPLKKPRKS